MPRADAGFQPTHAGATWRKPARGAGLMSSRWKLVPTATEATWTLIDRRSGLHRQFPTAAEAIAFVRAQRRSEGEQSC